MVTLKRLGKAFTACSSLAKSIQRLYEESLNDTLSWDSSSEDEMSGHNEKDELESQMREVITRQPGIQVTRNHGGPSSYKSSNTTPCDSVETTHEVSGDDCWPYTNTEPTNPSCFSAPPDMNKTADTSRGHEGLKTQSFHGMHDPWSLSSKTGSDSRRTAGPNPQWRPPLMALKSPEACRKGRTSSRKIRRKQHIRLTRHFSCDPAVPEMNRLTADILDPGGRGVTATNHFSKYNP